MEAVSALANVWLLGIVILLVALILGVLWPRLDP